MEDVTVAQAQSGGGRVAYDDLGAGEPALLLMPGWCANRTVFRRLAPLLSRRRRVLALDWRGHGGSDAPTSDFGEDGLVEDALAVVAASGAREVVPVALAHAGWVAIVLARRLGPRVPRIVLVDWLVLGAPPPFREALAGMQSPETWRPTLDRLFDFWLHGGADPEVERFVRTEMGAYGFPMWSRAGREISRAYEREGSPLAALGRPSPPVPTLHVYATPDDPEFLRAQQEFAAAHPWFRVRKLEARTHFPMIEAPEKVAAEILAD
ncbi:MAG TPA: alpha/beta hydrolase [Thermoanaerobaculia bacterium]|nr:alpha/beta hydrolase [Thermoanaerobaculia bacterium]